MKVVTVANGSLKHPRCYYRAKVGDRGVYILNEKDDQMRRRELDKEKRHWK